MARAVHLLFVGVTLLAMLVVSAPHPARAAMSSEEFESCLLTKINTSRANAGAPALTMASDLNPQVRAWSEWMRNNTFRHMTSSERDPILPDGTYTWGENIAWTSNTSNSACDQVHNMLMNSSGHRANILNSSFRFAALGAHGDGSGWWVTELFFAANGYTPPCAPPCDDEMLFYKDTGEYAFYDVRPDGSLGTPLASGFGYSGGWSLVANLDLDGNGQDEILFYRDDGTFKYYDVGPDGSLGDLLQSGTNYTAGWSSITGTDLDGDGRDEILFYRDDGLYRYYNIHPDGSIGSPIRLGNDYTRDWTSITAVDLDGDGQDEMFFYRDDGLYRYYNIRPDGSIGSPIRAGNDYSQGWNAITAVSLD